LLVGAGGMSADLAIMFLMFHGLSRFLTLDSVQLVLLILGSLVLTYTGIQGLKSNSPGLTDTTKDLREHDENGRLLNSYLTGASIAAFNPLNLLFWLGIYGSVLSESFENDNLFEAFYINSAIFIGIGLWNTNLAFSVFFGKKLLRPNILKVICMSASAVLLFCGIYFGFKAILRAKEYIHLVL